MTLRLCNKPTISYLQASTRMSHGYGVFVRAFLTSLDRAVAQVPPQNADLYQALKLADPVMANRIHHTDVRKIRRSLQVPSG